MSGEKSGRREKEQEIVCGHIWTVSYLLYNNIPFLRTEMQNGKVVFIFPDNSAIQQITQQFMLNPEVRLQEYIGIFQRVKNLVYQIKGQGNGRKQGMGKIAQKNTG